jgi:hypothetical protein
VAEFHLFSAEIAFIHMNDFYQLPTALLWLATLLLLIIGFAPAILIIEWAYTSPVYYLLFLPYIPFAQFAFTPFFTLIGSYRYYSPMLLGYMATDKQIDLHSGTSFDYLMVMRNTKAGRGFRNTIFMYHLEGILKLIDLIDSKQILPSVQVVGTSYFFNQRTLRKMGFEMQKASGFYTLNLYLNFIDLCWMYSVSQGKFALPNLGNAQKAWTTGERLVEHRPQIETLYNYLKNNTTR